jgi:hypothetical protein
MANSKGVLYQDTATSGEYLFDIGQKVIGSADVDFDPVTNEIFIARYVTSPEPSYPQDEWVFKPILAIMTDQQPWMTGSLDHYYISRRMVGGSNQFAFSLNATDFSGALPVPASVGTANPVLGNPYASFHVQGGHVQPFHDSLRRELALIPQNPFASGTLQHNNWAQTGDGNIGYVNIRVSNNHTGYENWELFQIANGSGYVGDISQSGTGNTNMNWASTDVNFSDNDVAPDEHIFKIQSTDNGVSWSITNTAHTTVVFIYNEATSVNYEITFTGSNDLWTVKKHNGTSFVTVSGSAQSSYALGAHTKQYGYYDLRGPLGTNGEANDQQKFSFHYVGTPGYYSVGTNNP